MKQTVQTGVISAFCPSAAPPLCSAGVFDWDVSLWLPRLSAVYSRRPPRCHRQDILLWSLSRLGRGDGKWFLVHVWLNVEASGERRDMNQFVWLSKKKERCGWRKGDKGRAAEIPRHALNTWTTPCALGGQEVSSNWLHVCQFVQICMCVFINLALGLIARPRKHTKRSFSSGDGRVSLPQAACSI